MCVGNTALEAAPGVGWPLLGAIVVDVVPLTCTGGAICMDCLSIVSSSSSSGRSAAAAERPIGPASVAIGGGAGVVVVVEGAMALAELATRSAPSSSSPTRCAWLSSMHFVGGVAAAWKRKRFCFAVCFSAIMGVDCEAAGKSLSSISVACTCVEGHSAAPVCHWILQVRLSSSSGGPCAPASAPPGEGTTRSAARGGPGCGGCAPKSRSGKRRPAPPAHAAKATGCSRV